MILTLFIAKNSLNTKDLNQISMVASILKTPLLNGNKLIKSYIDLIKSKLSILIFSK